MKIGVLYKQLFLSQRTAKVAAISMLALCTLAMVLGSQTGELGLFDYFDDIIRIILSLFLYYGYREHNLLSVQAGCCGILFSLVYYQASYVFNNLLAKGATYFMALGFWGSFFLACQAMVLIIECLFLLNHFETFILKKRDYLRITINQTTICVLLSFLILLLFVVFKLNKTHMLTAYYVAENLSLVASYMLVACCELILAIDAEEIS